MRKLLSVLGISLLLACHLPDLELPDLAMGPAHDLAGGPVHDLAMAERHDLGTFLSQCGQPGDKGNSLGVGKFCTTISDCMSAGLKTNICSSLGNGPSPSPDDTYYCTIYPCRSDGGAGQCGENAECICAGGGSSGCACTPSHCLGVPDGGP